MNPFETRLLGNTGIKIPSLGFGGAPLGELFEKVEHLQAIETLDEAYASGIRYYDTAPWYGHGLSEHRLGNLLYQKNRHEFILSTKVGRVYRPFKGDPVLFDGSPWVGGLPFEWNFDYSAVGFERSFLDSTMRLGLNRIDLLVIHDLDRSYHGKSVSKKPIKENLTRKRKGMASKAIKTSAPRKPILKESNNMVARIQKLANISKINQ